MKILKAKVLTGKDAEKAFTKKSIRELLKEHGIDPPSREESQDMIDVWTGKRIDEDQ